MDVGFRPFCISLAVPIVILSNSPGIELYIGGDTGAFRNTVGPAILMFPFRTALDRPFRERTNSSLQYYGDRLIIVIGLAFYL